MEKVCQVRREHPVNFGPLGATKNHGPLETDRVLAYRKLYMIISSSSASECSRQCSTTL